MLLILNILFLVLQLASMGVLGGFVNIPLLTLLVPLLCVINLVFFTIWMLRFQWPAMLFIGVLAISLQEWQLLYQFENRGIPTSKGLNVMSYNVRSFNRFKWLEDDNVSSSIESFVNETNADVICFQEFSKLVQSIKDVGVKVLIDWVPAHFPSDEFSLAKFDGTCLYEHQDPRQGRHAEWGTLCYNYGRAEVRSFLIGSAFSWLDRYGIDGFRVDAVASMLYLDYGRKDGEWIPNENGGNYKRNFCSSIVNCSFVPRKRSSMV